MLGWQSLAFFTVIVFIPFFNVSSEQDCSGLLSEVGAIAPRCAAAVKHTCSALRLNRVQAVPRSCISLEPLNGRVVAPLVIDIQFIF